MAVYRPNPDYLAAQITSLAQQDHNDIRLIAVVADMVSAELTGTLADKAGLTAELVVPDEPLDAVRAFEAGLAEVLRLTDEAGPQDGAEPLVALCDQDDIWHPDRLSRGIAALAESGAALVHSDARLVGPDGTSTVHRSMFKFERRHRDPGLRGLLYRNNITGMTVLMRMELLRQALPFPRQNGVHFYHDLWLGLLASATDGVCLIDAPLVNYRQHGENAIGAVDRQNRGLRSLPGRLRRANMMWLRREAAGYGLARYLAHEVHWRLAKTGTGTKAGPRKLRPLRPFLTRLKGSGTHLWDALRLVLTGHVGLARIAFGFALVTTGRLVWSLRMALGNGLREALTRFDRQLYSMSPGIVPKLAELEEETTRKAQNHTALIDLRKTARWQPDFTAPVPALTILVPTLNPSEIFAGIVTALDIGVGLAARGFHVRFIATDLPVSSPGTTRAFLLKRLPHDTALPGAAERIHLHCGVQNQTIPAHRGDLFLATAWWTAHMAEKLTRRHGYDNPRFLYLIQDFEPNFYSWGQEFADAMASYHYDFDPLFNTTLLRDYFRDEGFDFAGSDALTFHPAIDIGRYSAGKRKPGQTPKRLALYGRPEVARNMYPTAIEALARFIEAEALDPDDIEIVSVGLKHAPVQLPRKLTLKSLGKLPWEDYPGYLLGVDFGLSLMHSPHPSHPPIEMAASGVRVVTNHFGPKDLGQLSPAILSCAPTPVALAETLSRAWRMEPVADSDRQIDLNRLGQSPEAMLDILAEQLTHRLPRQT